MALVLVRHGETEWNRVGRRQGQLDSPLTEAGLGTARRLGEVVEPLGVEAIFTSPLGRARSTAAEIGDRLGLGPVVIDDLAEVHHGAFAGLTTAEMGDRFPDAWAARARDKFRWAFPDGESYQAAVVRARRALSDIRRHAASTSLVVTHEMLGRLIRMQVLRLAPEEALALRHPHDVAYLLDGSGERAFR